MRVLMITGDSRFGPGNPRFELQKSAVDDLVVMYWGRGHLFPKLPLGHFDVVTAQDPLWRGHLAMHVARRLHAKLNLQVHSDLSALPGLKRWWAGFNLRKADSVRVVSERIKQQVERMSVRVPIVVLPVYVDISKFESIERKPHDSKNILWIGRLENEKNPLGAVAVFEKVLLSEPRARLTFLGEGGLRRELEIYAKRLPITLVGWQDPAPFLSEADVVLSTSWHESWGASIIEALAAGVPVVAPDVGAAKEAGAKVLPRNELASGVVAILKEGTRGHLVLQIPDAEGWKKQWQKTL